jgi:hypothetical protein
LLWVLILEKAWAKINGSYEISDGGYEYEAISCLTGAPTHFISHRTAEKNELWN